MRPFQEEGQVASGGPKNKNIENNPMQRSPIGAMVPHFASDGWFATAAGPLLGAG